MNDLESDLLLCLLITILLPMPLSAANDDRPKLDLSGQWQAALDPLQTVDNHQPPAAHRCSPVPCLAWNAQ